jgi:hypothetical protein
MIVSLVAAGAAGLALLLAGRVSPALRMVGMSCVVLWLAGAPLAQRSLTLGSRRPGVSGPTTAAPLAIAARRLVTADAFETAHVRPLPPSAADATGWRFDLAGSALDLIVLESVPAGDTVGDWERRLLKRIGTRLAQGGRLLVELPAPPGVADALGRFRPASAGAAWTGYRLRLSSETAQYEALVFGRDIPALMARNTRTTEFQVSLQPLSASLDAGR